VVSAGLAGEDPKMMAAFDAVYLIQLDVDEWGWGTGKTGFDFTGIPIFFRLDSHGAQTGDWIDGTAWGADTYGNIAATMGPWFAQP
jgi:hypothetical protein